MILFRRRRISSCVANNRVFFQDPVLVMNGKTLSIIMQYVSYLAKITVGHLKKRDIGKFVKATYYFLRGHPVARYVTKVPGN